MSRQTDLEELVLHEGTSMDGIVVLIRMGQDPGWDRMKRLIDALKELDEILRGQTTLDRRLSYAFWALAFYGQQDIGSWAREGRPWPPELANEELISLLTYVECLFEGGLTEIRAAIDNFQRTSFNAVAMQVDELGDMELLRSVEGEGYWLHYLGRFEYEPRHG